MLCQSLHLTSFYSLKAAEFRLWLREEKGKVGRAALSESQYETDRCAVHR